MLSLYITNKKKKGGGQNAIRQRLEQRCNEKTGRVSPSHVSTSRDHSILRDLKPEILWPTKDFQNNRGPDMALFRIRRHTRRNPKNHIPPMTIATLFTMVAIFLSDLIFTLSQSLLLFLSALTLLLRYLSKNCP